MTKQAIFEFMCDDSSDTITIEIKKLDENDSVEQTVLRFPLDGELIKMFHIFCKGVHKTHMIENMKVRNFYFKMKYQKKEKESFPPNISLKEGEQP